MDRLADEAVQMLKGMVAIPSVSFEEDRVRDYISEVLKGYGVRHETVKNNIVALDENFSPEKKTLMLCAHIDTVPPGTGYSFDPYRPDYGKAAAILGHSEDELVCGLGSNDDGGSVVSLCAAFRHFRKKDLPFNIVLVLCCEEERSGPGGMTWIWEHYNEIPGLENAGKPDWAIIGEPTGMKAATSERGLLVIDGEAEGVSGHAARGEGVNALYIALEDIDRLRKFDFRKVSPVMGRVRLTVTQINAGTAHNVVPDRCRFVVDIRPTEMYGNEEILEELQAVCRSRLTARNLRNRSSATFPGSPLPECLGRTGIGTFSSPTTSDWIRVRCDAVKMGPGQSERSHRKDEYILVSEIEEAIRTYIRFIDNFAAMAEEGKK
ncbi:MAG: M20/M25/M40 family metallo-hydrolase [Bacteroidetes bacterium]|uniref:M20/M25/M40 family metallo-hydrolase n=1 Tax=Candidatus Cryptobacteroides merdigallinarum TaxID=2840770 RepID=A0A9D9EJZ8_9BACT|nr:M20/M25/M40 family metallo-hydrolase [Candidatus Cryptobacteroides merdigallinarum]